MNNGMQIPIAPHAAVNSQLQLPQHGTNPNGSAVPLSMSPAGWIVLSNGMLVPTSPTGVMQQPTRLPLQTLANMPMSPFGSPTTFLNSGSNLLPPKPTNAEIAIVPVPINKRTFATSTYKRFYIDSKAADFQYDLLGAVNNVLQCYASRINPTLDADELEEDLHTSMMKIQEDAFENGKALK